MNQIQTRFNTTRFFIVSLAILALIPRVAIAWTGSSWLEADWYEASRTKKNGAESLSTEIRHFQTNWNGFSSPLLKQITWSLPKVIENPTDPAKPKIAIIIDDLGYRWRDAKRLLALEQAFTFAIIPFTPYGKKIAQHAKENAIEVMLHIPMAPLNQSQRALTWETSLTPQMEKAEFQQMIESMLENIPHASGANNHGGSALTQDRKAMTWLMHELHSRGMYFIDSRTIASSVAEQAAREAQIAAETRDVFLDNNRDREAIEKQIKKLVAIAKKQGQAIGIGHPYPQTLNALEDFLPLLDDLNIELVSASELTHIEQTHTKQTEKAYEAHTVEKQNKNKPTINKQSSTIKKSSVKPLPGKQLLVLHQHCIDEFSAYSEI